MLDSSAFIVRELIASRLISEADRARAEEHAASHGRGVCESLAELGLVSQRDLAITRAKVCEHPYVELSSFDIDIGNARLLPRSVAERLGAFPLFVIDRVATVAVEDPLNLQALDQIRQTTQCEIEPVVCDTQRLRSMIARAYSLVQTHEEDGDEATGSGEAELANENEPIVAAVNQIVAAAVDAGASDIHINPDDRVLHLRHRVDGVLQPQQGPSLAAHASIVQRLKVMARLDLTQTRKPQDGKFRFTHKGRAVDVRLSVVPTIYGENVVLRLLASVGGIGGIPELGMPERVSQWFEKAIAAPHGMILVTGPTGSGKTTTLYTALSRLNAPERNIMTIEDPVEIRLPLVRQMQVNTEIGLTFASALRSVLRQDPDVILVGEIRDEETAHIAVQSALTGHLVLSTLHTNDAVGAIPRLRDFAVPTFAINAAVLGVLAQRLVRRVCDRCAVPDVPSEEDEPLRRLAPPDATFVRAEGCQACLNAGYKGRLGVFELLAIEGDVRRAVELEAPGAEILDVARSAGMSNMLEDGVAKAARHLTTLEEVRRVIPVSTAEAPGPLSRRAAA